MLSGDVTVGRDLRVCLVTGGTRGLGRVITLTLLKRGYRVIANYVRNDEDAGSIEREGAFIFKADISKIEECLRLKEFIKERFGVLYAIINNAGMTRDELLVRFKEKDWDEVIGINLKGAFNTIRILSETMIGGGHIVNIISYSGIRGKAGQAAYSASKSALIGLTLTTAQELSALNIRVNAVAPGYMDTSMGRANPHAMKKASEESLLKRLTAPEEVAGFIAYLIETETITGQVFRIDSRI